MNVKTIEILKKKTIKQGRRLTTLTRSLLYTDGPSSAALSNAIQNTHPLRTGLAGLCFFKTCGMVCGTLCDTLTLTTCLDMLLSFD